MNNATVIPPALAAILDALGRYQWLAPGEAAARFATDGETLDRLFSLLVGSLIAAHRELSDPVARFTMLPADFRRLMLPLWDKALTLLRDGLASGGGLRSEPAFRFIESIAPRPGSRTPTPGVLVVGLIDGSAYATVPGDRVRAYSALEEEPARRIGDAPDDFTIIEDIFRDHPELGWTDGLAIAQAKHVSERQFRELVGPVRRGLRFKPYSPGRKKQKKSP